MKETSDSLFREIILYGNCPSYPKLCLYQRVVTIPPLVPWLSPFIMASTELPSWTYIPANRQPRESEVFYYRISPPLLLADKEAVVYCMVWWWLLFRFCCLTCSLYCLKFVAMLLLFLVENIWIISLAFHNHRLTYTQHHSLLGPHQYVCQGWGGRINRFTDMGREERQTYRLRFLIICTLP